MARNTATALLKTQHKKVETLLKKLATGRSEAAAILEEVASNLAAHMHIEQQLFYPAVREVDEDLVLESFEEHSVAELTLKRLLATPTEDPTFTAKATVLKELIMHHVEEEENDLFPKVEKKLGAERSAELGVKMKALFEEALQQGHEALLSNGSRTTADVAERRVLRDMHAAAE